MTHTETDGSVEAAANSLFESLASDPEFQEEHSEEPSESEVEESAEQDEPEGDESEEESEESEETEESDDSEEESEGTDDQRITLEIDGKPVEITLDELKKGYSREADYTRKTQALAETRKAVEVEIQQTRAEREQYAGTLQKLEAALLEFAPAEPNWEQLRKENPGEFAAQWAEKQQRDLDLAAVQAERQKLEIQQSAEREAEFQAYLDGQKNALIEAIPEWRDSEKAGTEKKALMDYAKGLGFSDEDLGSVYDHRLILLLRKSAKYDELTTKGAEITKVAPKVLKPGSRDANPNRGKKSDAARAMERLARTGSKQDAAAAFMAILPDD